MSALPGMFFPTEKLNKEIFCYDYYTKLKYKKNIGNFEESYQSIKNKKKYSRIDFRKSIRDSGAFLDKDETKYDMKKFSLYYC